jgi:hypothetical protein
MNGLSLFSWPQIAWVLWLGRILELMPAITAGAVEILRADQRRHALRSGALAALTLPDFEAVDT